MKTFYKSLLVIVILGLPFLLIARYSTEYLQLNIETTKGETFTSYVMEYRHHFEIDSFPVNAKEFFVQKCIQGNSEKKVDSLEYYAGLLKYRYEPFENDTSSLMLLEMYNQKKVALDDIVSMRAIRYVLVSDLTALWGNVKDIDTSWINDRIIDKFSFEVEDFICHWDIMFHEKNEKTNAFMNSLVNLNSYISNFIEEKGITEGESPGTYYFNQEDSDFLWKKISEVLSEKGKLKIMIVCECTD